ncbi:MAG: phytanoyl-CoA dioxygenase family protein [Alphaproteobacteria bacterium]|nr:phytanoyl-CoA dioxygenase family protein [Alphaproteobacteria bacterium]
MTSICSIGGTAVPESMLGAPRSLDARSTTPPAIQAALAEEGVVVLRGGVDRSAVLEARREVLHRLAEMQEIAEPVDEAIATGTSRRLERAPDANAFWRSVCEGPALRRAAHGPAMRALATAALGRRAKPFDFLWLRTMVVGRASPLHFDHVYMNRGSAHVLTAWVPLGDVPLAAGPIVFVEGSHRLEDVIARYRGVDVDRDGLPGSFPDDAIAFAHARGCRLLTTDFAAGDIVLFGMFTLHGSCDNRLGGGRVRLSCDVRWQPEGEAEDDRWFGSPPSGHKGQSYGGMNGARPLGEAYSAR